MSNSIEAIVSLLITSMCMCILIIHCLPEVDLKEGQSCPRPCISPTSENLGIFFNLCTIYIIIKCSLCAST